MTKIFSDFHEAVTFLCYFLLVVAKESKVRSKNFSIYNELYAFCWQQKKVMSDRKFFNLQ